jgi:hypothetical protein
LHLLFRVAQNSKTTSKLLIGIYALLIDRNVGAAVDLEYDVSECRDPMLAISARAAATEDTGRGARSVRLGAVRSKLVL